MNLEKPFCEAKRESAEAALRRELAEAEERIEELERETPYQYFDTTRR